MTRSRLSRHVRHNFAHSRRFPLSQENTLWGRPFLVSFNFRIESVQKGYLPVGGFCGWAPTVNIPPICSSDQSLISRPANTKWLASDDSKPPKHESHANAGEQQ